jgi:hypothetical protein
MAKTDKTIKQRQPRSPQEQTLIGTCQRAQQRAESGAENFSIK